jgi:hypothetical protein
MLPFQASANHQVDSDISSVEAALKAKLLHTDKLKVNFEGQPHVFM